MTKQHATVFAPYLERTSRLFLPTLVATAVLALTACTSTPLPEWPASPGLSTTPAPTQTPAVVTPSEPAPSASVTPVASNTHVQALPYNASVAALFPDPSERYSTPGLSEGRTRFTTNSELADLLRELSASSLNHNPRLGVLNSGNAQSGQPIYALVATQAPAITPLALDETGKPTVMIVAGQQGTDVAATEAAVALTKELGAGGLLAPLLDSINIIVVPRANPDGFDKDIAATADGTDLRFDHLKLHTPEARFLAQLVRDYHPSVLLDASEFAAIEPTLQRYGAVRANDVGLQYAVTPNGHEFITKAAREWLHQPTNSALSQAGLRVDWAFDAAGDTADSGFAMGTVEPTTLSNVSSLKNAASMQTSSRGSDLQRVHAQRRVHSQVQAMTAVLQNAAARAKDLQQVNAFVMRDIASRACHGNLTVQAQPSAEQRDVSLIDANSAQFVQMPAPWSSSLKLSQARTRSNACGYWLSPNAMQAIERLGLLGVNVQRVAELSSIDTEAYQTTDGGNALSLQRGNMEVPPGSYYVTMNQPLAYVAAAALEPDSPYSFYSNGVIQNLGDVARVVSLPQIVFDEE